MGLEIGPVYGSGLAGKGRLIRASKCRRFFGQRVRAIVRTGDKQQAKQNDSSFHWHTSDAV